MRHTFKQAEKKKLIEARGWTEIHCEIGILVASVSTRQTILFSRENSWLNKPRKDVETGSVWQTANATGSESRTVARHESKGQNVCVMCDGGREGVIGAQSLFMSDWQWEFPSWLEDWGLGRTRICNMHSDPICTPFFEQSIKVAFKHSWRPVWANVTLSDVSVVVVVCFSESAELQLSAGVPDPTSPAALLDLTETFFFPWTWSHSLRVAIEMTRNHVFCHRISCRLRDLLTVLSWV